MKTLISAAFLLAMLAADTVRNVPRAGSVSEGDSKVTIHFERGGCPTKCSVFLLTIRPDRSVEYEGLEHTRVLGKRTYTISTEAYKAITDALGRARVDRLKDRYEGVPGRDAGTIILRLSWGERVKEIIHFLPSLDVPEELGELEDAIVKNAYPSK